MAGAALTLNQAAAACGVSHSTIKRRLPDFENAHQDRSGYWRVPVGDLLATGFHLRPKAADPTGPTVTEDGDRGKGGSDLAQAQARIEALIAELASERMARQLAEAIAAERAASLNRADLALRALTGRPEPVEPVLVATTTPAAAQAPAPKPPEPGPAPSPRASRRWPWNRR